MEYTTLMEYIDLYLSFLAGAAFITFIWSCVVGTRGAAVLCAVCTVLCVVTVLI